MLNLCKSVQESSEEMLDFKTRQLVSIGLSIDKLSIKVYEKQIFSSDFHPIRVYMFGLSFLTTLNIYKDYFKGHQRLHSCMSVKQSSVHANCDQRQNLP